jgi:predicted Holliday junction resolvase-like endonuclease
MDVFALLFILAFLVLLIALVVMSICKSIKLKKLNVSKRRVNYGLSKEKAERISLNTQKVYMRPYDLESSMMKREVNEVQEKWKETLPKHSTRIKLRAYRKLRSKRKGHSKGVKCKKK